MTAERIVTGLREPDGRGEELVFFCVRLYTRFLQLLFQQRPSGDFHWSEHEEDSEIHITGESPIPRVVLEGQPAIVVQHGPSQFCNLSLNNKVEEDAHTGRQVFQDLLACTMSMSCIANKSAVEARRIAWLVMTSIRIHKVLLQRSGLHKVGDELSMTPPTPPGQLVQPEADISAVMVTTHSPFFVMWKASVTPLDAPAVREIDAALRSSMVPAIATSSLARQSVIRPPSIHGRPVVGEGIGESIPMDPPPITTTIKVT